MIDISRIDYSHLDRPEVLMSLFHPRPDYGPPKKFQNAIDQLIPVEKDVVISGRFHVAGKSALNVFFFTETGKSSPTMMTWGLFTTNWASIFCL